MCGIVGFLAKRPEHREHLGELLTPMLECMGERGPDSAGLAVFSQPVAAPLRRFNLFTPRDGFDWQELRSALERERSVQSDLEPNGRHAIVKAPLTPPDFAEWLGQRYPKLHILSVGQCIDMYKDVGTPKEIAARYHLRDLKGTHAVGHTRMATESAVSPAHAHPFTAGEDFCLVHNGSLSNPHSLRRKLERRGVRFETDNDTEAACRFLEWRMREGDGLEEALRKGFTELDGFYTLLMATADRMVLVRDAFACKPAVVAETDDYVAVSSEFRALAHLPGIAKARLFEPEPEKIYSWKV